MVRGERVRVSSGQERGGVGMCSPRATAFRPLPVSASAFCVLRPAITCLHPSLFPPCKLALHLIRAHLHRRYGGCKLHGRKEECSARKGKGRGKQGAKIAFRQETFRGAPDGLEQGRRRSEDEQAPECWKRTSRDLSSARQIASAWIGAIFRGKRARLRAQISLRESGRPCSITFGPQFGVQPLEDPENPRC
ncbi:hypothetical protein K466DRAFT_91126 [Polyporus arcularius HHB13444]|uniref:Uncharacterized protein n=1 Tax=Polyporus arcularius HHB13444 TaxID=1314778 RepID=A0A5C3PE07_9APHY|nr:hypothetical protein K466DRAFT_91126 [Polyporus arcularius HHB13444]